MNRADFIKSLVAGLVVLPSAAKLAAELPPRSLMEWLDDVRKEQPKGTVICGNEALDYFREKYDAMPDPTRGIVHNLGDPKYRFAYEQVPYRWNSDGKLLLPYLEENTERGRMHRLNPEWDNAPIEIVIAYGGSTVFFAPYYRKTFKLTAENLKAA